MKALFKAIKSVGQDGGSAILDRIQETVEAAFNRIGDVVSNDRLVTVNLNIGATPSGGGAPAPVDTRIAHGLGHRFATWEIVRKGAQADVWESSSQPSPDRFLVLQSSAAVTVTLRIT